MSIETFETWSFYIGIGILVGWMCYIMYKLAKESNAGKFGTIAIFVVLGLGVFGFLIKGIIHWILGDVGD